MTPAVDVQDAFCIFQSQAGAAVALQGLTLSVEPGEVVVVLGPSGSGKTTLLRAVAGFERLSAGSVSVFGVPLGLLGSRALAAFRAANLGFLDQHYARALSPDLSCQDTVALQLCLLGRELRESRRIADELLKRVGLLERRNDRPEALSGGEQQRVALCAAVAHRPRLLLADEPAGELDADNATTIYQLLAEIAREVRATALIVSHDPAAVSISDRLVQIRDGRVAEQTVAGRAPALVVSRGGWVRLPTASFGASEIPALVAAERRRDDLVLRPSGQAPVVRSAGPRRSDRLAPAPDTTVVAELRSVSKSYDSRAVFAGLDHVFRNGRFIVVVGRSGSGKTTLLHLLAGVERPSAGDVVILGESLARKDRAELAAIRRRQIALVTQEPGLVPYLSAVENVTLGLRLRGESDAGRRAEKALRDVGLGSQLEQRVSSLSAGQRQRVAIARAIAADVALLLVDEPTARLDEESARSTGRLLAETARDRGLALVCATHDPLLIELAEEVIHLEAEPAPSRRISSGYPS